MLGFIYKDLCLLKKDLLFNTISIVLFIIAATCVPYAGFQELTELGFHVMAPAYLLVCTVFGTLVYTIKLIELDERKRWSSFVISSPMGYKQLILSKYFLAMALCWIPVVVHAFGEVIGLFITNTISGLTGITVTGFYFIILYCAVEFPFQFRYGSKNGVKYKAGLFLLLFYLGMIYLLFGPPIDSNEIIDYLFKLAKGEVQLPEWMQYTGVILPYVAVGAYYISYKISCRVYLKGVERYEV